MVVWVVLRPTGAVLAYSFECVYDVAMIHASRVSFELRIERRFEVLFQKRVRVFHQGFQTRENR